MATENRNPAPIEARGASENDLLAGGVNSETKASQAKNQSETALAAAYRAAQERVAQR